MYVFTTDGDSGFEYGAKCLIKASDKILKFNNLRTVPFNYIVYEFYSVLFRVDGSVMASVRKAFLPQPL